MQIEFASHRGVKRRVRNKSHECERATRLDKYYTSQAVAAQCLFLMEPFIGRDTLLIEPSAGDGSFIHATERDIIGLDIDPDGNQVITCDFLTLPATRRKNIAFIGNPPFGKQGELAADFINRALQMAGLVGFIVPITFRRWKTQCRISAHARLAFDYELPSRSFEFCSREVDVACCFQIWTTDENAPDYRLKEKPPSNHADFEMWRCNLRESPKNAYTNDWDFAVPRQGSYDYSKKLWSVEKLHPSRDYTLFKASTPAALRRLLRIDFPALSRSAGMKPGVGMLDVVKAYKELEGHHLPPRHPI